jgi:hypothetical protein
VVDESAGHVMGRCRNVRATVRCSTGAGWPAVAALRMRLWASTAAFAPRGRNGRPQFGAPPRDVSAASAAFRVLARGEHLGPIGGTRRGGVGGEVVAQLGELDGAHLDGRAGVGDKVAPSRCPATSSQFGRLELTWAKTRRTTPSLSVRACVVERALPGGELDALPVRVAERDAPVAARRRADLEEHRLIGLALLNGNGHPRRSTATPVHLGAIGAPSRRRLLLDVRGSA